MTKRILCVDDDPNVLRAFERQFRKQFDLYTAQGPEMGLQRLKNDGPFAVLVSDLRMPVMDGIEFPVRARKNWPDTVRIVLTGQADLKTAIAAVNEGNVFQFLSKPCPSQMLARALEAGLDHHRLITAERELMEHTLRASIGVMSEILSLANPVAFSRAQRIRRYVLHIARQLNLTGQWQYELAMLSQIGCVAVPPDVLEEYYDAQPLDAREESILLSQGRVGQNLLARIPCPEEVADIVGNQSVPGNLAEGTGNTVSIGSDLLKVAIDYDHLLMSGANTAAALSEMRERGSYDPSFLGALEQVEVQQEAREVRRLGVSALKAGMTTNSEVRSQTGLLLMGVGQELTSAAITRLRTFALITGVVEPISVRMPHAPRVPVAEGPEAGT